MQGCNFSLIYLSHCREAYIVCVALCHHQGKATSPWHFYCHPKDQSSKCHKNARVGSGLGPPISSPSLNYITFLCLTSYYPSTLSILLGILQLHSSTETFIYLLVPVVGEGYFSTVLFAWELVVMEKGNNRESWKTQLLLGATLLTRLHCREDCSLLIRVWVLILNTCMRMLPIGCLIFVYIHCNISSTEDNTEDAIEIQSGIRDNEREP